MKKCAAIISVLFLLLVFCLIAGCGGKVASFGKPTKPTNTTPSMKEQLQTTMDKANKAMPYIVNWSAYKTGVEPPLMLKIAQQLVEGYPSLRKYLNAQGLFDSKDYASIERIIDTEDPVK